MALRFITRSAARQCASATHSRAKDAIASAGETSLITRFISVAGWRASALATDRYVTAWEAFHQPRTIDYPFTIFQLQLDKNGDGVGKASVATKIKQDKDGTIELENFSSEPVLLNEVHRQK